MTTTDYIQVTAKVNPAQPWSDLLISELGEIGYESFEETLTGFKAFILKEEFDQVKLDAVELPIESEDDVTFSFSTEIINSRNWNVEWESNFEPVEVDDQCYIRAPFHASKAGYKYEIVIEPKMSFGTGHHETTTLMVSWMLETNFTGKKVLDMGCGTGILAILASKMGAGDILAIDNYPFAWENALENIAKNNTENVDAKLGDATLLGHEKFDVILANITKNVLKEDFATYTKILNPGGIIFISGFFAEDIPELTRLAQSLGMQEKGHKQKKDWVALKFDSK